jgi:hypothetical protein
MKQSIWVPLNEAGLRISITLHGSRQQGGRKLPRRLKREVEACAQVTDQKRQRIVGKSRLWKRFSIDKRHHSRPNVVAALIETSINFLCASGLGFLYFSYPRLGIIDLCLERGLLSVSCQSKAFLFSLTLTLYFRMLHKVVLTLNQ